MPCNGKISFNFDQQGCSTAARQSTTQTLHCTAEPQVNEIKFAL